MGGGREGLSSHVPAVTLPTDGRAVDGCAGWPDRRGLLPVLRSLSRPWWGETFLKRSVAQMCVFTCLVTCFPPSLPFGACPSQQIPWGIPSLLTKAARRPCSRSPAETQPCLIWCKTHTGEIGVGGKPERTAFEGLCLAQPHLPLLESPTPGLRGLWGGARSLSCGVCSQSNRLVLCKGPQSKEEEKVEAKVFRLLQEGRGGENPPLPVGEYARAEKALPKGPLPPGRERHLASLLQAAGFRFPQSSSAQVYMGLKNALGSVGFLSWPQEPPCLDGPCSAASCAWAGGLSGWCWAHRLLPSRLCQRRGPTQQHGRKPPQALGHPSLRGSTRRPAAGSQGERPRIRVQILSTRSFPPWPLSSLRGEGSQ